MRNWRLSYYLPGPPPRAWFGIGPVWGSGDRLVGVALHIGPHGFSFEWRAL